MWSPLIDIGHTRVDSDASPTQPQSTSNKQIVVAKPLVGTRSDGKDFLFLLLNQLIDGVRCLCNRLLGLFLRSLNFILTRVARFLQLSQHVEGIVPGFANRNLTFLALLFRYLDKLFAPLLAQCGNWYTDDITIYLRI